jgi:DnaJ-class molecular chaperone
MKRNTLENEALKKAETERLQREQQERVNADRLRAEQEKAERIRAERTRAEHEQAQRERCERERASSDGTQASGIDWCYTLLGVSSTASVKEIETAYREKAKKHHPDHRGDEDIMKTLNAAYTLLTKTRRGGA